ncbi:L-histidine N(alpha)-methyltransferase [Streptomyces sp. NPDC050636]|uniref:L-histidine N(alpha)-methyltransferase n=1 Tax=Streptomyces sp. NPDC050636 TaxID=3154510 RepID=UPI00341FDA2F
MKGEEAHERRGGVHEVTLDADVDDAAQELRNGLMTHPRTLPTRFGYDETGSRLFEEIMELPEYYLPEAETALFNRYGHDIIRHAETTALVDLGAGNARKATLLLEALAHEHRLKAYTGIDLCPQPLREAAHRIKQRWPATEVSAVYGDFDVGLSWLSSQGERRLLALLGSTYGNLSRLERIRILDGVRHCCGPTDRLLLCIDHPGPTEAVEAAYTAGYCGPRPVRRLFALNRLTHLNRRYGANFDLDAFEPSVRYCPQTGTVTATLRSTQHPAPRRHLHPPRLGCALRGRGTPRTRDHAQVHRAARRSRTRRARPDLPPALDRGTLPVLSHPLPVLIHGFPNARASNSGASSGAVGVHPHVHRRVRLCYVRSPPLRAQPQSSSMVLSKSGTGVLEAR